ncbi:MAG: hypothetical protein ACI8WA_000366 [Polaribacter sp.]|jgi:hypothetical protein
MELSKLKQRGISFDLNTKLSIFKTMKKRFFKIVASVNKAVLPSFTKRQLDISKASKIQLAIIGWRAYITIHSLD